MTGNIRTYDQPGLGLHPEDTGITAMNQGARRIGVFYNQGAADIESAGRRLEEGVDLYSKVQNEVQTHQQISHGTVAESGLLLDLTNKWNAIAANPKTDPNDPTIKQKFFDDQVEPALQQFQEGFTTQRSQDWAAERAGSLREHFVQKTTADISTLAGVAVVDNVRKVANTLAATVHGDPSSMDHAISTIDSSIGDIFASSPGMGAEAAAHARVVGEEMKNQVVKSGIFGAIERNPEAGLAMASDPKYAPYIDINEARQFATYARMDQRMQEEVGKQQEVKASQDKANAFFTRLANPNSPTGLAVPPNWMTAVASDPTMRVEEKRSLIEMGQSVASHGDSPQSSPGLVSDILMRSLLPDGDPKKATPAEVYTYLGKNDGKMLKNSDAKFVLDLLKPENAGTLDLLKTAETNAYSIITPSYSAIQPTAADTTKRLRFQEWFVPAYQQAVASGMTPSQAVTKLITPENLDQFTHAVGDDVAQPSAFKVMLQHLLGGGDNPKTAPSPANRPSLDSFFGPGKT